MSKQDLIIYGAGGHAKVVAEIAETLGYQIAGVLDADPNIQNMLTYTVNAPIALQDGQKWVIGIGNNSVRKKIAGAESKKYVTLVHPSANISKYSSFGEGTVVMAGVTVNADVSIGKHCVVNTNASVDHDCVIADYVHLSPNVALGGNVRIGEGTHVGIGACVLQGITIGQACTIGAGAVIIRDVPDGATVVGNPGRIIK